MCKDPGTPIEYFGLMQMLKNFGVKRNLCFIFSAPSLSKNRSPATERADIYRSYKQIQHFQKSWNIARNTVP